MSRVYPGAFADYIAVPARGVLGGNAVKVPPSLGDIAALAEPLSCAVNAQELARVGLGDSVVVVGFGPLGALHCEAARARGAARIVVVQRHGLFHFPDPDLRPPAHGEPLRRPPQGGRLFVSGGSDSSPRDVEVAVGILAGGRVSPRVITHRLPLQEFHAGLELMKQSQGLKILLVPGSHHASSE